MQKVLINLKLIHGNVLIYININLMNICVTIANLLHSRCGNNKKLYIKDYS